MEAKTDGSGAREWQRVKKAGTYMHEGNNERMNEAFARQEVSAFDEARGFLRMHGVQGRQTRQNIRFPRRSCGGLLMDGWDVD